MFEWNEDYSVGIDALDDQHKHLLDIGQELMDMIKHQSAHDLYDDVIDAVNRMKDYTVYHFETEERLMADAGYEGLEDHAAEHVRFIDKLEAVDFSELDENQSEFIMNILKFVSTWIVRHIVGSDFEYREALSAHLAHSAAL